MTLEIAIAELEQEVADDTALDETFDLDCEETREWPVLLDDEVTQPYQIAPPLVAPWLTEECAGMP